MKPDLHRYLLWQLLGWLGVGGVAVALHLTVNLPAWAAVALVAAFIVKDALMYRVMRHTLGPVRPPLVGLHGRAVERLAPHGYVRVNGELWKARTATTGPIPEGALVIVREVHGLTLIVDRPP